MNKKTKLTILIIGLILVGTTYAYAKEVVSVELTGKVTYTSQNLMQESGTLLDKYRADYSASLDIWKYSDKVKNIIISDDKTKPEEYEYRYDLTTSNSKKIYGYLVENGDSKTPYDLYIMANGIIYAPENATGLFSFPNVEKISGLEFIEFENTTNMTAMFLGNEKLTEANVKSINTSNATNTSYMFNDCDKLNVSEKSFDLTNVTNKNHMFNQDLSNVVRLNATSDKNTNFATTPVTGKYYIESTKNDANPVYYYRGNVSDNNIIFGGYCWKIVRTTDSGGVKLIYNGTPKHSSIALEKSKYTNVINDSSIPFEFDNSTLVWKSKNKNHNSSSTITFNISTSGEYIIKYDISSEKNYDEAKFYKDGSLIKTVSGIDSNTISLGYLSNSTKIKVIYSKDVSINNGKDQISFSLLSGSSTAINCNNSDTNSEIGKSYFNTNSNSPAYLGYMYGSVYDISSKYLGSQSDVYKYGSIATWDGSKYVLEDVKTSSSWNSNRIELSEKYFYTCFNSNGECSKIYYVVSYADSSYVYYLTLSAGEMIEDALEKMQKNETDSAIKIYIDNWYVNNLKMYSDKLEDTIWYSDRKFATGTLSMTESLTENARSSKSGSYNRIYTLKKISVTCDNKNNCYTVSNTNGNKSGSYPIGLLTADEFVLAGAIPENKVNFYLNSGSEYWSMTPNDNSKNNVGMFVLSSYGEIGNGYVSSKTRGVRPSISLKAGIDYVSGTGTVNDPYIVE